MTFINQKLLARRRVHFIGNSSFPITTVSSDVWNAICISRISSTRLAAEHDMKIYLLIVLMGSLWTAIRFTSATKARTERLPN